MTNSCLFEQIKAKIGLNEQNSMSTTKVYPNPASDFLIIENALEEFSRYIIYNERGQQLRHDEFDSSINISELCAGIYYLEVFTKNDQAVRLKFVKAK